MLGERISGTVKVKKQVIQVPLVTLRIDYEPTFTTSERSTDQWTSAPSYDIRKSR
ncbi:predicted protein [Sclerotinia sclerotiorum 1980 UF-70]|uniref:Uncharacterized protein n=1 Tax=Sclerotinia sclerotiorum (strain ATCC 18683 / 1980 / Ss-1) TaxID=665079 RepID=A7EW23_SCLS1|nr:predicted protein [Sclerotinia sclerotiorum 1980 UF-70]EDN93665.1 predicted protein [Sclerotinia sclerotiorum 1980 UF-70]